MSSENAGSAYAKGDDAGVIMTDCGQPSRVARASAGRALASRSASLGRGLAQTSPPNRRYRLFRQTVLSRCEGRVCDPLLRRSVLRSGSACLYAGQQVRWAVRERP
jgi:hypothetical protein